MNDNLGFPLSLHKSDFENNLEFHPSPLNSLCISETKTLKMPCSKTTWNMNTSNMQKSWYKWTPKFPPLKPNNLNCFTPHVKCSNRLFQNSFLIPLLGSRLKISKNVLSKI